MKDKFNYRELDKIIHSPVRLGIMSALISTDEVDFKFLKDKLGLSDGNLSANMTKLEEAGFITVRKFFAENKPKTVYRLTETGRKAFRGYVENLEKIIKENFSSK
ncbi:winged helix-turn-helix domain-containing protein [candidate division KSB1 bacterium]